MLRSLFAILIAITLAGCAIEGGVQRESTAPPAPVATNEAVSAVPSTSAVVTAAPSTTLRIGLTEEPGDLLPYHNDAADERVTAPISELLFPTPLLVLNYGYTTTGVLERVPSLANGDIVIGLAQVYLDQSGAITTTRTEVVTQVQQINVSFRWNKALRWSDGTPVTADDSLFAYDLARRGDLGDEARARLALLERYEKVDEHTTRAILKPDFTDPAYLTTFWTPLPRHLLADLDPATIRHSDFALLPVGYGPYKIARRDRGNLRLERNEHYGGPQSDAETISFVFRAELAQLGESVAGGSLDLVAAEPTDPALFTKLAAERASGRVVLATVMNPIWEHLDFNLDVPLYQDFRVRRAIAFGINRQGMIDTLVGGIGQPLDSWIVPGQWAAAPADQLTRYAYNPDEARRLLDEAGLVDSNGDGKRDRKGELIVLRLTTTAGSPLREQTAAHFKADMEALGLAVEIQALPTAELYASNGPLYRRSFELALFAWIAGPDPRGWERWSCAGVPNEGNGWMGNNFPGWCFFEADQAIRTATTSLDIPKRQAAYLRQQQLFTQELPALPLFQRTTLVVSSPTLTGLQPDPTAPITWNIAAWRRK